MTCARSIDPIDRQPRCKHDMLIGQCSWCKGLPDIPDLDGVRDVYPGDTRPLVWVTCERYVDCARCGSPIRLGSPAAFSQADGGSVGTCCEDAP